MCIAARIGIGDEAAKGEGIDDLTFRCLGGQALPLDPGRRVLSPVTRWAQPVGESETVRTLSRTVMNLFGRSIMPRLHQGEHEQKHCSGRFRLFLPCPHRCKHERNSVYESYVNVLFYLRRCGHGKNG